MLRQSGAALLFALLGVGLFGAAVVAQSDQYIDSLFRARFPASGPGAAVAVIRDGKLAHNAAGLDSTRAHPTPQFAPGTRYEYSNTGYVLLALLYSELPASR